MSRWRRRRLTWTGGPPGGGCSTSASARHIAIHVREEGRGAGATGIQPATRRRRDGICPPRKFVGSCGCCPVCLAGWARSPHAKHLLTHPGRPLGLEQAWVGQGTSAGLNLAASLHVPARVARGRMGNSSSRDAAGKPRRGSRRCGAAGERGGRRRAQQSHRACSAGRGAVMMYTAIAGVLMHPARAVPARACLVL